MFGLTLTNAVGVVLFGALYTVAGTGRLSLSGFLACLGVLFALVTALWLRTERRHRALEPLRRLGRAALGLVAVVIGTPIFVLMPLFWLDTRLPPEVGLNRLLAPIMVVVLVSLVLVVLVNVAGAVVAIAAAFADRARLTRGT
jgi:Flp pilus assembly protein TadB